jgi:four helix bundle protein
MKDHKDLDVWKNLCYSQKITKHFPLDENTDYLVRLNAVVSVPSNIAEGAARKGDKEFIQFLYIAMGSISEIETQLILAERLHFIDSIKFNTNWKN